MIPVNLKMNFAFSGFNLVFAPVETIKTGQFVDRGSLAIGVNSKVMIAGDVAAVVSNGNSEIDRCPSHHQVAIDR